MPYWFVPVLWVLFLMLVAGVVGYCFGEEQGHRRGIPRADLERVLDLVTPELINGACVGCGGRKVACSPPFVAHNPGCSELDRFVEVRALLQI